MTKEEFDKLLWNLWQETWFMSSTHAMEQTNSFKELESKGEIIIPFLVESLGKDTNPIIPILMMLPKIVGLSPVPFESRGIVPEMVTSWQNWYKNET